MIAKPHTTFTRPYWDYVFSLDRAWKAKEIDLLELGARAVWGLIWHEPNKVDRYFGSLTK